MNVLPLASNVNDSAADLLADAEFLAGTGAAAAVMIFGGLAIYRTYRWHRQMQQPETNQAQDLEELAKALQDEPDLGADEMERIRAAIERQQRDAPNPPI